MPIAPTFDKKKWDLGIVKVDGTTMIGLQLLRNKNNTPYLYEELDEEFLSAQYFTGTPGYGNLPPEKELALRQDNWNAGFGQLFFDDESRYYYTINGDGRFKNQFLLGPTSTAIAAPSYPSAPTITNADMELTTGWTGGSRSGTQAHGGTYSWSRSQVAGGGTATTTQDMSTSLKGGTYTFTCWIYVDEGTASGKIGIDDGVDVSYSSTSSAASWTQLSVTKHISIAATQLQLVLSITSGGGAGVNAYFDDAAITITSQTVGASKIAIDYNSNNYRAFGRFLTKLNGTGDGWTAVADCRAPITAMESFDDSFLYIATEDTTVIEDCEDTWNEYADAAVTASLDTGDYKVGSGSAKFVCGAGLGVARIATEAITSTDLSMKSGVTFWIKSTVALSSGDLKLYLDDSASCASPIETIDIPAVSANVWTKVYLRLASASSDTAIISIGLYQVVDKGAMTLWVDDVKAAVSYYYMGAGEVFTQSTLAGESSFAKYFQRVGNTLYKALPPNRLTSATNPTNGGSWAAVTTIDSTLNEITGLEELAGLIYIAKEDQPFYITSGGVVTRLEPSVTALRSSTTGKNTFAWKNWLFVPCGDQSLFRYDSVEGTKDYVSPALYITDSADFDGTIQALAGDAEFLFAVVDNATKIEILAGKHDRDLGKWVWHSLAEITLTGAEHMMTSTVYARRLWISSTSSSDSVYWIPLSSMYGNLSDDTSYSFKTGGYMVTSWLHANFKDSDKAYLNVTLFSEDCTANIYWSVSYQKYGDSSWTDLATNFTTSPSQTVAIPNDGSSNKPVSEYFRLKITGTTNDTTKTPKLTGFKIDGILYPTRRRTIHCIVRCDDNITLNDGTKSRVTGKDIKTALDEASLTATYPQTFYDFFGDTRTVKVLPGSKAKVIYDETQSHSVMAYELFMRRIS